MNTVEGSAEGSPVGAARRRFGPFVFDPGTLELFRDGVPVDLEPRSARILGLLLERAGTLVSREVLRSFGWPRLPGVADDSLNTCVRQIREALGDDARAPRWVETLRGRGYRFIGRVVAEGDGAPDEEGAGHVATAGHVTRVRVVRWGAAVAAAVLVLLQAPSQPTGASTADAALATDLAGVRHRLWSTMDGAGALRLAEDAARRHPSSAEAHALHATTLLFRARSAEAWAAVGRALTLAPDNATALLAAANLHMLDGAWPAAGSVLARAVDAAPNDAHARVSLAFFYTVNGRFDDASTALDQALALHPLSPIVLGDAGLLHLWAGRYDEALEACALAVRVEPRAEWALPCAFDAARMGGREADAVAWGHRLVAASAGAEAAAEDVPGLLGLRARLLERAADAGRDDPYELAVTYSALGRLDAAERALARAVENPHFGVLGAAVDPRLAPLRARPGFRTALGRLGLGV